MEPGEQNNIDRMTETNKNANRSFLDKFEGRTNKVGKLGVQAALIGGKDNEHDNPDQFRKVDLDVLIPSNPEKHNNIVKRRESLGKPPLKSPQQKDYVPSAYTPQTTSKDDTLSSNHPPSRSLSNSTNNSRGKYIFGKYLKLDKQALSHIEFLQSIQQKSFFKKGRGQSLNLI